MTACTLERQWVPYIVASLVTFLGGFVILLPFRVAWIVCSEERKKMLGNYKKTQSRMANIRTSAEAILSGNSILSKLVMIFFWFGDMASIAIYLTEAMMFDPEKRDACGPVLGEPLPTVWLILMVFNLIRFVIRLLSAHDKFLMWVDIYSVVDHLTIVPTFVGAYLDRNWLALRFLVVIQVLNIPDILQMVHVIRDRNRIRFAKAISLLLSIWLLGAGLILLLENNGDPFRDYSNNSPLHFGECFYFILITLTTIGYGDISPRTILGKICIILLVISALAMFGSLIPELGKVFASRCKYRKPYKKSYNRKHVVICGGITFETLTTVVRNFIHADSTITDTDIVIIDKDKPSSELQAFFRRRFNDVTFIRGSVMDIPTLQLAKIDSETAVFILANRRAENPEEEDSANIMRATAVKNMSTETRIIIQLLRHHNKVQLLNIPGWEPYKDDGDEVICISELQMALIAQNCLAPGFVTMFSNLICMRSEDRSSTDPRMKNYCSGAGHEIYTQEFAKDSEYVDQPFADVAVKCFDKFKVLLMAIECRPNGDNGPIEIKINPDQNFIIREGHVGFFIAQGPEQLKKIEPKRRGKPGGLLRDYSDEHGDKDALKYHDGQELTQITAGILDSPEGKNNNQNVSFAFDALDTTEIFHCCPSTPIDNAILDKHEAQKMNFENHVIFVLRSGNKASIDGEDVPDGGEISLKNFVSPLRANCIRENDIKDIVFYTDRSNLEDEWQHICMFPRLFIYKPTKSSLKDLTHLNIHKCAICVVTSVKGASAIDDYLVDKRTILMTMNILSIRKNQQETIDTGDLMNHDTFRKEIAVGRDFPILSQLELDASIPYIDDEDNDDPKAPMFQTMPYVCGRVLMTSILDSSVSAAYMNGKVLKLVRALLTGGDEIDHENITKRSAVHRTTSIDSTNPRRRCYLDLLDRNHGPLERFKDCEDFGKLMTDALNASGLLCLGIYRLWEKEKSKDIHQQRRYVITCPPPEFKLEEPDKIYVLRPFQPEIESV